MSHHPMVVNLIKRSFWPTTARVMNAIIIIIDNHHHHRKFKTSLAPHNLQTSILRLVSGCSQCSEPEQPLVREA